MIAMMSEHVGLTGALVICNGKAPKDLDSRGVCTRVPVDHNEDDLVATVAMT